MTNGKRIAIDLYEQLYNEGALNKNFKKGIISKRINRFSLFHPLFTIEPLYMMEQVGDGFRCHTRGNNYLKEEGIG